MNPPGIAAFVSPHGFGHAARASAVLAEVHARTGAALDIFTTAPRWFFEESLGAPFRHHAVVVDVGFSQRSALEFDRDATVSALRGLVPFSPELIERLARKVSDAGCRAVLCDISALGVAVAEAAGIPSVLVENFTWSWLYAPLVHEAPELGTLGAELDAWTKRATVHLQARPVCVRDPACELIEPISRGPRLDRSAVRAAMGLEGDRPLVVVTMGGYGEAMAFLDRLAGQSDVTFLVTGARASGVHGNVHIFDNNTPIYMPDLLRAADAVVAKLGYGMVSEVWREGLPFAHVTRPDSREMSALEAFAREELSGFLVTREGYTDGVWIDRLPELLAMPRRPHAHGGAERAAEVLTDAAGLSVS